MNESSVYCRNSSLSHFLPSIFDFKTYFRSSESYPVLVHPAGPSLLEQHRGRAERSQVSLRRASGLFLDWFHGYKGQLSSTGMYYIYHMNLS